MRILGVDPGLAHTGWGVIETRGNRLYCLEHGSIVTGKESEQPLRLNEIFESLIELIQGFDPDLMAVESLYFAKNRRSAIPVAEARGAVLISAAQKGIPLVSYTPLEIKQALTGNGRAEKAQVQEMVRLMLGLQEIPRPDHAADALAAAVCSYHMYQFEQRKELR
ncbi:MAG TPA: crossover junction endodeoxyribonuclease RuvC [Sediminispirochaeta sp.]|nr:crossover junction endodeoxyribonuclease RuvC [Sediminispirochaeta sp.]